MIQSPPPEINPSEVGSGAAFSPGSPGAHRRALPDSWDRIMLRIDANGAGDSRESAPVMPTWDAGHRRPSAPARCMIVNAAPPRPASASLRAYEQLGSPAPRPGNIRPGAGSRTRWHCRGRRGIPLSVCQPGGGAHAGLFAHGADRARLATEFCAARAPGGPATNRGQPGKPSCPGHHDHPAARRRGTGDQLYQHPRRHRRAILRRGHPARCDRGEPPHSP